MSWTDWFQAVLALVIWREARGEGNEGMRAVAHVIRNRVMATHLPDTWDDIIEAKWQFSSMTAPGDPMLVQWPKQPDPTFDSAMLIAKSVYTGVDVDNTSGATLYANLAVCSPKWDFSKLIKVSTLGRHTFFREK